jgi:hypothetical protein
VHQGLRRLRDGDGDGVGAVVPDGNGGDAAELCGRGGGDRLRDGVEDAMGRGGDVARSARV